jgi:uncharacterized protein YbjT (DUF2867 family)
MTAQQGPKILVLGAGGLIGGFLAADLAARGFPLTAAARKFSAAQRMALSDVAREIPVGEYDTAQLAALLHDTGADVVVNCLGVLQVRPGEPDIHDGFVARLIEALRQAGRPILLVHVSIPGSADEDKTGFARTKRSADRRIAESGLPYVILRPGFVWAPAAFGGSALMRTLAVLPINLPKREGEAPFANIAIEDITETVARVATRWQAGERNWHAVWDLMHPVPATVGSVLASLRRWFGIAEGFRFTPPEFLLDLGAKASDLAAYLGWAPPIRSTAIAEMRRGVAGDPRAWMLDTGIVPRALADVFANHSPPVQEQWFARLYLLKALIIVALAIFWCVSGGIVLAFSFKAAADILVAHGFSISEANFVTLASSLMDTCVGLAIAVRRTSRAGLVAGIAVSLFYMIGAAFLTPEIWIEPLGALVKTGPAIVLMLVALAISSER